MYKAKTSLGGQNQRVPSAFKPIERTTNMLDGCMIVPAIETDPRPKDCPEIQLSIKLSWSIYSITLSVEVYSPLVAYRQTTI